MRKKIAEHMVLSRRTSAHVHSVFEVNFSRVAQDPRGEEGRVRARRRKLDLPVVHRQGGRSTRCAPCRSSTRRSTATTIVYHKDINIGIAVALDWGLIVPVIKHADEKNLLGLSRAVADLADARAQPSS